MLRKCFKKSSFWWFYKKSLNLKTHKKKKKLQNKFTFSQSKIQTLSKHFQGKFSNHFYTLETKTIQINLKKSFYSLIYGIIH